MKRLLLYFTAFAVMAIVAVGGWAAWKLWPRTTTYYTDADAIRAEAAAARLRDILWQPPLPLKELDSPDDASEPALSSDGRLMLFTRGRAGRNADLYQCERATGDAWSAPRPVSDLNTGCDELGPALAPDGRTLFYYSDRPGSVGGYDLWFARRTDAGWTPPVNAGPAVNTPFNEASPALAPDGRTLYFASDRPADNAAAPTSQAEAPTAGPDAPDATRQFDLYASLLRADGPRPAEPLTALNTTDNETAPAVNPYGDFLYFASNRPGGLGGYDLYRARTVAGALQPPENLGADVNTAANELDPELHLGGFALYFATDRAAGDRAAESAVAATPEGDRSPYQLHRALSREVFRQDHTQRGEIDWAELWRLIAPNLLWASLALLLILLFFALMRDFRERQIGLFAKCLLASLLVHLVLLLLFNAWQVTATLADAFSGRGRLQVALVSSAAGSEIGRQIRGDLSDAAAPPSVELAARADFQPSPQAPSPSIDESRVDRAQVEFVEAATATPATPTDAGAPADAAQPAAPKPEPAPIEALPAAIVALDSPAAPSPAAATEPSAAAPDAQNSPVDAPSPAEVLPAGAAATDETTLDPAAVPVDAMVATPSAAPEPARAGDAPVRPGDAPPPDIVPATVVDAGAAGPPELALPARPARIADVEPAPDAPDAVATLDGLLAERVPASQPADADQGLELTTADASLTALSTAAPARLEPDAPDANASRVAKVGPMIDTAPMPEAPSLVANDLQLPAAPSAAPADVSETLASAQADQALPPRAHPAATESPESAAATPDVLSPETRGATSDAIGSATSLFAENGPADAPTVPEMAPAARKPSAVAPAALTGLALGAPDAAPQSSPVDADAPRVAAALSPAVPRLGALADASSAAAPEEIRLAPQPVDAAAVTSLAATSAGDRAPGDAAVAATDRAPAPGDAAAVPPVALTLGLLSETSAPPAPADDAPPGGPAPGVPETPRLAAIGDPTSIAAPAEVRLAPAPLRAAVLASAPAAPRGAGDGAAAPGDVAPPAPAAGRPAPVLLAAVRLDLPGETKPPRAVVHGRVFDARTGEPIAAAAVRLVHAGDETLDVPVDADGAYRLDLPPVPDNFALSASAEGYVPESVNVAAATLARGPVRADFRLEPQTELVIALEENPDVHHLGNDRYEGRVNSQFQRESEGSVYRATFKLGDEHLKRSIARAEIHLLAKGVQCPHVLRVNGHLVPRRLRSSPADGSFGEFRAEFDAAWLKAGRNQFKLTAKECRGDLDDFEFVNVRIRLYREE